MDHSFKKKLAATTSLVVALVGYNGRRAYATAGCTGASATYVCSGSVTTTQNITGVNEATVSTASGFSVDTSGTSGANAITITGDGALSFIDINAATITAPANAVGLVVRSGGDDGGTPGSVTINANSTISGGFEGIFSTNSGTGALSITANGSVTGTAGPGISAANYNGTNLTIVTGSSSDITGGSYAGAIKADLGNSPTGAMSITVNGDATDTAGPGINATVQGTAATTLTINTGSSSNVTGGAGNGISATAAMTGLLSITADGAVTGSTSGIAAYNNGNGSGTGGALTITTGPSSVITGGSRDGIFAENFSGGTTSMSITTYGTVTTTGTNGGNGIFAENFGTGSLTVKAYGAVSSATYNGIDALLSNGSGLTVYTGPSSNITGQTNGILANNNGGGATSITANGIVTGTTIDGIYAKNASTGTSLTITTGASSVITGYHKGIYADNQGTGALSITADGTVTTTASVSGAWGGIFAFNSSNGTGLTITTGASSSVTSDNNGIFAKNYGDGVLSITTNNTVTGTRSDGIYARGDTNGLAGGISITANGDVTGTDGSGIFALNASYNGNVVITTGSSSTVNGGIDGIFTKNYGVFNSPSPNLTITTGSGSTVIGGTNGIYAGNKAYSGTLTITTETGTEITGGTDGIKAINDGSGALSITTSNGSVTGTSNDGISAYSKTANLSITTGSGSDITGGVNGIYTHNTGAGALTIINNGYVKGATGLYINGNGTTAGSLTIEGGSTVKGTGGTAISLGLTANLPITINGGSIIGDVIDTAPANGRSPVTIAGNFVTAGNFDVSSVAIAAGKTLEISSGDTITANSGFTTSTGTLTFGVTSAASHGEIVLTNGAATLTGGTIDVDVAASPTLTNGEYIEIIDGDGNTTTHAIVGGPGSTPETVIDNSSAFDFKIVNGVGEGSGDDTDLYLEVLTASGTPGSCTATGPNVSCTGAATSTQTIGPLNEAAVTTASGFSVDTATGNGITVTGDGALSFADTHASTIISSGGIGLYMSALADDAAIPGSITISGDSNITGSTYGIKAVNIGTGGISITADGSVTGTSVHGILAENLTGSGNITINTGTGSSVTGGIHGIYAVNVGTGAISITALGAVTGTNGDAIYALNGTGSGSITINTGTSSVINGSLGINAKNYGISGISITANGAVTGTSPTGEGISAYNYSTGNGITINTGTTGTSSVVTGGTGISAYNKGTGGISITADGIVTGTSSTSTGIIAFNGIAGTDNVTVYTGPSSSITGAAGISAFNKGTGGVSVTTNGAVTGTSYEGIVAYNSSAGTGLSITTGPNSVVSSPTKGIYASNLGSGALTITNHGDIVGAIGLEVYGNGSAAASTITNESTGTIQGTGGTAISLKNLTEPLSIMINGGHIIGDVIDTAPAAGYSTVTVAQNFTSQGNFDVSNFDVSSGANFTFGAGDTITSENPVSDNGTITVSSAGSSIIGDLLVHASGALDVNDSFGVTGALTDNGTVNIATGKTLTVGSTAAGTGTLDFELKGGLSTTTGTNGQLASGAPVDLTNETLKVNVDPTSGLILNDSRFEIITGTGGAATTPVATSTTTPVLMTSSDTAAYKFYYTTGAYAGSTLGGPIGDINGDDDVYVIAVRNNISTASLGPLITANDTAIAAALSAIGSSDASLATIQGIVGSASSPAVLHTYLQSLTPPVDGGAQTAALGVGADIQDISGNQMTARRDGDSASGMAAGSPYYYEKNGASMWVEGYGQHANQGMMDSVNGYDANTWGGAVGLDSTTLMDNAIVGIAFNYGHSVIDSANANTTTTDLGNYGFNLYGTYDLGQKAFMTAQAGYAYNTIGSTRHNSDLAGGNAYGSTNSDQYSAKLDLGRDYTVGGSIANGLAMVPMTLTPDISAAYTYLDTQGYTETGAAPLTVASNSQNFLSLGIGGTAAWKIKDDSGNMLKPSLHAGYAYEAVADKIQATSSFTSDPAVSFITDGASPARNVFDVGAKLVYATKANWDFSANYDFQVKTDYTSNTGELRATAHF